MVSTSLACQTHAPHEYRRGERLTPVRIAILGPLWVTGPDGRPVDVGGARLRTLLIRLALEPGQVVGAEALIAAVWAGEPPAGAANALQTLVSRLRRVLP